MNKIALLVTGMSLFGMSAYAQSIGAADALLKTLNTSSADLQSIDKEKANHQAIQDEIHLENPVARQLFSEWNGKPELSYEFNAWVKSFFANQFESFAHLHSSMEKKIDALSSDGLRQSLQAAYLYSLYRLELPQTFVDQWLASQENALFQNSKASLALDEALSSQGGFDEWLISKQIILTPSQEVLVKQIGVARHPIWLSLNAFAFQRKSLLAEEFLPKLAINSPFRPKLSMTVALAYARKGDLANAAKTLKIYYEPWVSQSKDAQAISSYSLQIARLLYQVGALDGAIQYYTKVPKSSVDFITAQEELAWTYLRKGDLVQLRGLLSTLNSAVVGDQFRPESSLVKAISDLKLCYYADVEKDFRNFLSQHLPWAKKIETAIQASESTLPRHPDEYSRYVMNAYKSRTDEMSKLDGLASRSVGAALPAVGPQKHWTQAMTQMQTTLENTKKRQAEEFRRQWKSDKFVLVEAIRKMQFVKVELLSQVSEAKRLSEVKSMPLDKQDELKKQIKANSDQSFPFDGVIWPDELFKLKSMTQGQCMGQI